MMANDSLRSSSSEAKGLPDARERDERRYRSDAATHGAPRGAARAAAIMSQAVPQRIQKELFRAIEEKSIGPDHRLYALERRECSGWAS